MQLKVVNCKCSLFCLISVGNTDSQLPKLFYDYNLKWPTLISNVKIWLFSSAQLDEIKGMASPIKLLMLTEESTIILMWATLNSKSHEFPTHANQTKQLQNSQCSSVKSYLNFIICITTPFMQRGLPQMCRLPTMWDSGRL